jgi:hypothetical protein
VRRVTVPAIAAALAIASLGVASVAGVASSPASAAVDPCAGAPRAPYVDVADGHTHASAIDCLHGLDVIRGRLVDAFAPGASLRRDQMATIVAGAITAAGGDLPPPERGAFGDVTGGAHRDAIERLAAAGIVEGRAAGRYDPTARVPRGPSWSARTTTSSVPPGSRHRMPSGTTTGTRTRPPSTGPRSSASPSGPAPRPSRRRRSPCGARPRPSSRASSRERPRRAR